MKEDSSFRLLIALRWSMLKVLAVTAIVGVTVVLAAHYSPLDLTPLWIAITGAVLGVAGFVYWYIRYFPSFRERAKRTAKAASKTARV